jgi:16S rRNA (cytosine1402-N4)-methyltransferase
LHVPVLLQEMVEALIPRSGGMYLDGTLGAGGYAEAILRASSPAGTVVGLDLDPDAVERSARRLAEFGDRFKPIQGGFQQAPEILSSLGIDRIDGAVLDLGISSNQLEDPQRGFSFRFDGPLDMRFDTDSGGTLLEYLRTTSRERLEATLSTYGEERFSRRIARGIIDARNRGKLATTRDLADVVTRLVPRRGSRIHPATRTFQALRIAVNEELENLERALEGIPRLIKPGGRFCVVSYHSLEDRRVKLSFRERSREIGRWVLVTAKPIRPSAEELRTNPRSRSARMRVLEAAAPDGQV